MAKKFSNTKRVDMTSYINSAKELVDSSTWNDDIPEDQIAVKIKDVSKMYKIYKRSWYRILNAFKKIDYKEFYALNNITINLPKGEAIGILGTNGSGKSTLLKMVTGVAKPSTGSIEVNGRIAAMLELTSGFDKELTGYENIFLKGTTLGIPEEEMEERMEDIAAFADIGDYLYQPVRTYSSGMKSRLGFAINVNVNPDILIVDEVLAVGDDTFRLKCLAKMDEFRKNGKTILFVSHNLFMVKGFCTKAMWIQDGELIVKGDTQSVCKIYEDYLKEVRSKKRILTSEEKQDEADEILSKFDILQVTSFKYLNKYKSPQRKRKFVYEEPITFEIEYDVKKPIENDLICCFSLRDIADREIFATDKQDQNHKINKELGHHVIRFSMENLQLLPGTYKVAGEFWNPKAGLHFKFAKERSFIVTSNTKLPSGIVNIDYSIENNDITIEEIFNTRIAEEKKAAEAKAQ